MIRNAIITTTILTLAMLLPPARRFLGRVKRAALAIATDRRIPRWLSWPLVALALVPMPGEFDELLAGILLLCMLPRYGRYIREAWTASAAPAVPVAALAAA